MKKFILSLFLILPLLSACSFANIPLSKMTEAEARQVAESSCIKGGEALEAGYYHEAAQTWTFDANLNMRREGCMSLCVVSVATQTAQIEWQCAAEELSAVSQGSFGIYVAETGELVFSEEDIVTYEPTTGIFILTEERAKKMNNPVSNPEWPPNGLYQKEFIAKIGNEEIYRGKFWSQISSLSETGIIMLQDLLSGVDGRAFEVKSGYVSEPVAEDEKKINDERILERLKELNKLKD